MERSSCSNSGEDGGREVEFSVTVVCACLAPTPRPYEVVLVRFPCALPIDNANNYVWGAEMYIGRARSRIIYIRWA